MVNISFDVTRDSVKDLGLLIGDECIMTIEGVETKMNLLGIEFTGATASLQFVSTDIYLLKYIRDSPDTELNFIQR